MEKFYLTTTLPYVNASPHIGFALEMVQADIICRYEGLLGKEVIFNTGTDEHGLKIHRSAETAGKTTQAYVDEYAAKFDQLKLALNLSYNRFVRTTDAHHKLAAQAFWEKCLAAGDIYKKTYQVKYCVGCELEKTDSELENGHCILHPNLVIELIDEENYFFRWSKYQQPLLDFYAANPDFVVPDFRFNEIKQFVKDGLQDFSVSRLKTKMPWGVPVPNDDNQVMYVWFDALVNYVSTLGWPEDEKTFVDFWGTDDKRNAIQVAGKDNLRQQSAMWQAMLMSAGLPNSKQIMIHGFINSGGQKMSKSLGNVVDPYELLARLQELGLTPEQATDSLRYYLAREISTFEDSDFTWERFKDSYNANLANGIGNLTSRILKMATSNNVVPLKWNDDNGDESYKTLMAGYKLHQASDVIWEIISDCDSYIQKHEPFKLIKVDHEAAEKQIQHLLGELHHIGLLLNPFMTHTSDEILKALENLSSGNIPHLFPRIE